MPLAIPMNVLDPPNNDSKMDDPSTSTSSWTAISSPSWRANFGWLLPGASTLISTSSCGVGTTTTTTQSQSQLQSQWQAKELEIVQCLQGNHQEDVDLWHLRQLALSPGGFVSTALRKRAWPKVVGVHQLLLQNQTAVQELVEPLPANVRQVHNLVRRTHWNMEEHLRQSRKEHSQRRHSASQQQQPDVVMEENDDDENHQPLQQVSFVLPHTMRAMHSHHNHNHNDTNGDEASVDTATLSLQSYSSLATRQEQQVLTNILLNLLRQPGPYRYFPYVGIQSVTAVLVLQLESPSLASFVLQQLASYSLRDYCVCPPQDDHDDDDDDTPTTCNQWQTKKGAPDDDQDEVSCSFMKLLQRVDHQLWKHLTDIGISKTPDCIVTSWIPCWFAQDISHLDVVGRLWDVFMVSQPSCCLYMSVALTVTFRDVLLATPPDFATLTEAFARFPSQLCEPDETEVVIATCLQYMERYPSPRQAQKSSSFVPSWAMAPTAPNDWALLQQAKAMRNNNNNNNNNNSEITTTTLKTVGREKEARDAAITLAMERFPQAAVAAGVTMSHPSSSLWRKLLWLFLFVVLGLTVGPCLCFRNDISIEWTCWTMPAAEIQSEAIAKARTMMNRWALSNGTSKFVPRQLVWEAPSNSNVAVSTTEQGGGLVAEQTQTRGEQEARRRYQQERAKATKLMEEASKQEEARNNAQAKTTQEAKMAQEQARIAESSGLVVERIAKEKRLAKEQKKVRIAKEAADGQAHLEAEGVRVSEEEEGVAAEQAPRLEVERIEKEKQYRVEVTTRAEEERLAEQAKLEEEQTQSAAEDEARVETGRLAEEERLAEEASARAEAEEQAHIEAKTKAEEERLAEQAGRMQGEQSHLVEETRLDTATKETSKAEEAEIKAEDTTLQKGDTRNSEKKAGMEEVHHPAIEKSRSEAARLAHETSEQSRQAEIYAREAVSRMMVRSEHEKKESWDSNDRQTGDDLNGSPLMMEADIIAEAIRLVQEQDEVLEDKDAVAPQQDLIDVLKAHDDYVQKFQSYWKDPNEGDDNDSNPPRGIQVVRQSIGNKWGNFRKWSANKLERRRVRKDEHQQTRNGGK